MADFVVSDESDQGPKSRKRKRAQSGPQPANKKTSASASPDVASDEGEEMPAGSTAQKWRYDPNNIEPANVNAVKTVSKARPDKAKAKERPHEKDPEKRYPWLADIRDLDKKRPGEPGYNPSTVFVPKEAWAKFSPFEQQYWEIKHKLWDTIVFFKKGKFYELYENDATIGHQLFDLKLTDRVNMRMVGVPEGSLDQWVNQFVASGYKVARVEQSESALGKEMRERSEGPPKTKGKADKIIRRELAQILTAGTLVDGSMLPDAMATYCVAIKEVMDGETSVFGIAFVDAATGQFFVSEFEDDAELTKFGTFVAQTNPRELLLEKASLSTKALRILKNNTAPTTLWTYLKPGEEFWSADRTRREFDVGGYFRSGKDDGQEVWPAVLSESQDKEALMSALGALVHYLRVLMLDKDLLSQGYFTSYHPIRENGTLVLDGQTLTNLEIFTNTSDGSTEGTLFKLVDRCITPMGKRLLRQWVSHPLRDIQAINERLDASDVLYSDGRLAADVERYLRILPDVERLVSRINAGACKIEQFVRVIEAFQNISNLFDNLVELRGGSVLVDRLLDSVPDMDGLLDYWTKCFHFDEAKTGKAQSVRGYDEEFDEASDSVAAAQGDLDELLAKMKKSLGCRELQYTAVGKEIFQLEVPKNVKVPKDFEQMSAAGNKKRYYFPELRKLVRKYQEAEEIFNQVSKQFVRRMLKRFAGDMETWLAVLRIVSYVDCLMSLSQASRAFGEPSCRPEFVDEERSVVEFEELRHPCMLNSVDDFIPNDIKLGGDTPKFNLLTGANAAGKSTVLRMVSTWRRNLCSTGTKTNRTSQSCTAVIMAQIGCRVPARRARLTPVDRIMSRLGANDAIFAAQSTFFVELAETRKILADATPRSLVILDELGRGTSSGDGLAVAQATLHHVATHVGCLGFFATHYRSLAAEFASHPEVGPHRMAIRVDDAERRVTFLYRLEPGVADGSFGMHCASMCGIPARIVDAAETAARRWETESRAAQADRRRHFTATSRAAATAGAAASGDDDVEMKEAEEQLRKLVPLGVLSDVAAILRGGEGVGSNALAVLAKAIEAF